MSITIVDTGAVSPKDWYAEVDYDTKTWVPWNPDKWVLHWGGDPVSNAAAAGDPFAEIIQVGAWEHFHIHTRGWLGIAYNWLIGNSGTLYRGRGNNRSAATLGDEEPDGIPENHEAVAVAFLIGAGQTASPAALATFAKLYAANPALTKVIGHRDASTTTCPGEQLYDWVQAEGYREIGITSMGYAFPTDDQSPKSEIQWLQVALKRATGADITIDGAWGPATAAAKVAALGGADYGLTVGQAADLQHKWYQAVPPREHSNVQHSPDFALWTHEHPAGPGDWDEQRVAALEVDVEGLNAHTHDEGETGPPE